MISVRLWKKVRCDTFEENNYLGDVSTSQPEQVLTFALVAYYREVISEAQISLNNRGTPAPT